MSYSSCFNTANIELGCASSVGGIKEIYVLAGSITGTSLTADDTISGITGSGDLFKFELQKQTSNLTETFNVSIEAGTTYYEQATTAIFNKIDADKRNQLKLLAKNRSIELFVIDNNDNTYYLGSDFSGGAITAGTSETGTAFGDRNGYSVTISTYSKDPMKLLSAPLASVVSGITIN